MEIVQYVKTKFNVLKPNDPRKFFNTLITLYFATLKLKND